MIHELFSGLERTIHERLQMIEEVVQRGLTNPARPYTTPVAPAGAYVFGNGAEQLAMAAVLKRVAELEKQVAELSATNTPLIPRNPLEGIEVIPKKEVVLTETGPEPLSVADRLLLNSSALKALEKEEEEEEEDEEVIEEVAEEEEEVAEEEEEVAEEEEEVIEEVAEEEEEAEEEHELEDFEYRGSTYYRDPENNVFMIDEDGEFLAIGVWSEVKKKIIVKKPDA
jgi:TATA-binding protein-associated factor Taf7